MLVKASPADAPARDLMLKPLLSEILPNVQRNVNMGSPCLRLPPVIFAPGKPSLSGGVQATNQAKGQEDQNKQ